MANAWTRRKTWILLGGWLALLPAVAAAQEYSAEAIETYTQGMAAVEAGELERAIELFRESYEVHHGHPNALYNIGQCYERLGDIAQSINYYEQYLASDQAEGREEVYALIRELRARKAVFTLRTTPPGARVRVTDAGGTDLPEYDDLVTPCELELPTGTFVLHFEAEDHAPRTQVVDGGLGRNVTIDVALVPVTQGPEIPPEPFGEVGPVFVGAYGGPVIHLNGSEIFGSAGFGAFGGYTLFDGDWRLDVGGDLCIQPYPISSPSGDHLSWYLQITAVPTARWLVLEQLHLLGSLGIGVGIYVPPSQSGVTIPWVGRGVSGAISIVHFRPALGLEYLPLNWLGITLYPVALDLDIPVPLEGTPDTGFLVRYAAYLGLSFHI